MDLAHLPQQKKHAAKRVGRGLGSGRGKTSGRGTKGQKARGTVPAFLGGGGGRRSRLIKRLPFLRGVHNRQRPTGKPMTIRVERLNSITVKGPIAVDQLIREGVLPRQARRRGVRIVAGGRLSRAYTVAIPVSEKAGEEIARAGGKVLKGR